MPAVDANTNRFQTGQGYQYDFDRNLIQDVQGRQFTFDGDNKQVEIRNSASALIGKYFYDGNGKRVKKLTASETVIFVYDGLGKLVAEYSTANPVQSPTVNYTATDPLGSPRVITNKQGEIVSRRDFMPFGEQLAPDTTYRKSALKYNYADNVRQKFTGYQRDEESGLDFAEARYYNNNHGRFTAVDPLLASGKSTNPQTFNRYAYTMNRPLILTDPTGLQAGAPVKVQQDKVPKVTIIENPKAAENGNTHIAITRSTPYANANEKEIKSDGIVLKMKDGTAARFSFGVKLNYKIQFAEGVNAIDVSIREEVSSTLSHADGKTETTEFVKSIQVNRDGEFEDDVGAFLDKEIPAGTTTVSTQKLYIDATYVQPDGTKVKTSEIFRTNELTINSGDKYGNRSIVVKDITDYEENEILDFDN